jgi:hypothetical protein
MGKINVPADAELVRYLIDKVASLEEQVDWYKRVAGEDRHSVAAPPKEIDGNHFVNITPHTVQIPVAYEARWYRDKAERQYHVYMSSYRADGYGLQYYLSDNSKLNHVIIADMHRKVVMDLVRYMKDGHLRKRSEDETRK